MDKWTKIPGGIIDNRTNVTDYTIQKDGNPGYSICCADSISLANCSVVWGVNKPAYFTYALEVENVTEIKISDFTGKAAHPEKFEDITIH
ncbi:hypothetical protein [uncultured Draconibacterium sp.]|uniref:hypothetical protein n=1 Tax=uncultured Draconibacterium sp. TaxID=1573823 RepID=UPI0029C66562|nr:hypothetical protein [uncultured Draconibacterium sp.]